MSGCTALVPVDKTCCRAFSSFIGSSHCAEVMLMGHGGERAGLHAAIEECAAVNSFHASLLQTAVQMILA